MARPVHPLHLVRRWGPSVLDKAPALIGQAVSAAQNFALISIAARQLGREEFGHFAVAITVLWLLFGVLLAVVSEPILTRSGVPDADRWPILIGSALRFCFVVSFALGTACVGVSLLLPEPLRGSLLAVGFVLPAVATYETARTAALARLRGVSVLLMDLTWVAAWVAALWWTGPLTATGHLVAWGATSSCGLAVYALAHRSEWRRLCSGLTSSEFAAHSRGVKGWYLLEYLSTGGLAHLFTMSVSGVSGVVAVGGLRAAQAVMGPLNTLSNALRLVSVPVFSRAHTNLGTVPMALPITLSLVLLTLTVTLSLLLLAAPDSLGTALFGQTWTAAAPLVLAVGLQKAASAGLMGATTALRVSGAGSGSVRLRVGFASLGFSLGVAALLMWGLVTAMYVLAAVSAVETAAAWAMWLRRRDRTPQGTPDPIPVPVC